MTEPPTRNRGQKSQPTSFLWLTCFLLCELFLVALVPSVFSSFCGFYIWVYLVPSMWLFFSRWVTLEGINGLNFALEVNIGTVGKEARRRERGLGHCF